MPICKLSFAKSRSVVDPARGTGASEIPRNEAHIEVRRSASGPEGLRPGGTRDGGNPPKADKRSPSTLLRTVSLSNGRWTFSDSLRSILL
jgi:hypothetical protein